MLYVLNFSALTTLRLHKDISQFDVIIPSCPDWQLRGYLHKGSQDQQADPRTQEAGNPCTNFGFTDISLTNQLADSQLADKPVISTGMTKPNTN